MALPDPGLNKPFDRIVKAFAEEAPRLLLHLLGIAPLDADLAITHIRPETAPPVVFPDYVAVLVVGSAEPFTFHVEFQLDYYNDVPQTMARYGGSSGVAIPARRGLRAAAPACRPRS